MKEPSQAELRTPSGKTIFGLNPRLFWSITLISLVVIGAGVGGGLAARFAGSKKPTVTRSRDESATRDGASRSNAQTAGFQTAFITSTIGGSVITALTTITPTPFSNPCADTAAFTTSIQWAGISNGLINPVQLIWEFDLGSGQKCCENCWSMSPQKCNVWGYFPKGHPVDSGRDSCALLYDYPGSQKDGLCPAGRPQVGIVPGTVGQPYIIKENVGGPGPCAGLVYSALPT